MCNYRTLSFKLMYFYILLAYTNCLYARAHTQKNNSMRIDLAFYVKHGERIITIINSAKNNNKNNNGKVNIYTYQVSIFPNE